MKIAVEAFLLHHSERSGLMTYTEGLLNSLRRSDTASDYSLLYYSLRWKAADMPGPTGPNFNKKVLMVPDRPFPGRQAAIDRVFLPAFFSRNRVNVFHRVCGTTLPQGRGVFKILTIHDLRTLTMGDRQWAQNVGQYRKALSAADACVVVSECTKQDLIRHFGLDPAKINVIYLAADEKFKPSSPERLAAVREKYGINGPYFLSVGSVPRKNIEGIIKGFAGCRYRNDVSLVMTCRNDLDKYRALVKESGLEGRVVFLGDIGDGDMPGLYGASLGFVFPSLYEGFGLPIVEAMQCATPVITSTVSACPEVAGDAALLVDPHDAGAISQAMDTIAGNEQFRQGLAAKGLERAKLFSWDNFARQMMEVYASAG